MRHFHRRFATSSRRSTHTDAQTVVIGRCGGEERLAIVGERPPGYRTWNFANQLVNDEFRGVPSAWAGALAWVTSSSRQVQFKVAVASLLSMLIVAAIYWGEHATPAPNKTAALSTPSPSTSKPAVSIPPPPEGPHLVVGLQPYTGYAYLPDDLGVTPP
jgi:hypothetical protein